MKNKYIIICLFCAVFMSCDKEFVDINTNPNTSAVASKEFLFSNAQLTALNNNYYFTNVLNCGGFIQHYATYKEVSGVGDKYFANDFYQAPFFADAYPNSVNQIAEVIRASSVVATDVNKKSAARIWKVYIMHRLTDLYGDIPYSDAGKGFTDLIFTPKYDTQASIYADMLKELDEAAAAFDATKPTFGSADLLYAGDVAKWKKFAYSLMLRLGMRLTNVDNAASKTWVGKAIAGGVILNKSDNAVMRYSDGPQNYNRNPSAYEPRTRDFVPNSFGQNNIEGGKLSKTFIDHLVSKADPRLNVLSCVWVNKAIDTTTASQKGFPNGTRDALSPALLGAYSEPNQNTVFKMDAPLSILTNAETQLYLTEAAVRGWYSTPAADVYASAIKASMSNFDMYGTAGVISTDKINAYLAQNTLSSGTMDEKMAQIHTQLWVALYLDEIEVFSNWRRTGFPKLTPVNYPGNASGGTIPRRLIYPSVEAASNKTNYQATIGTQGADVFTTRVWWDKK